MKTVFIKGWNRTTLSKGQYKWHCPYCDLKLKTHLDDVEHGCFLKEYGLGNLASDCLSCVGITKKRFQNLLRIILRKKTIKCNCGFRLNILNTIGRLFGINYLLTTWKHGISPRQFKARRGLGPLKINTPAKAPGCGPLGCPVPNPHPYSLPPAEARIRPARGLKNETP